MAIDASAFWWEAPDGSVVRAEYLPQGYGNGAYLPGDAKELVARVDQFCADQEDLLRGPVLWMVGTDHQMPRPWLGRVVAEANDAQDDYHLAITPLEDHLRAAPTDDLPRWTGELRSAARANLLPGVASNRVDVRQAAAVAERQLERITEPLWALFTPDEPWPAALLDEAWLQLVRNAAHDSVCACSADEVVDAVQHRYAEARQIGEGLAARALRAFGLRLAAPGAVVVNPLARTRGGLVEVDVPGEGEVEGTQLLDETPATELLHRTTRASAPTIVERELDLRAEVHAVEVEPGDDGELVVTLLAELGRGEPVLPGPVRAQLERLASEAPEGAVRVEVRQPPATRVLARVEAVPGFGWQRWEPSTPANEVRASGLTMSNGLLTVEVDPTDGTFAVGDHRGLGRLVDDGDAGDTYNHCPPAGDVVVDAPDDVSVRVVDAGPVRARLAIDRRYRWPERVEGDRRVGEVVTEVTTTLELHAGEDLVRVTVELDNHAEDHRLRLWLPLPEPAATSEAECAFAIVERGLVGEGGSTERAVGTFPSRRFVQAGGLLVAHEGLVEYELVDVEDDRATALALTLLRCTGALSRGPMATRPLPAGPEVPLEGPQLRGRHRLRLAVHLGDRDPFAVADDAFVPLLVCRARGGGDQPPVGSALDLVGAQVSAVTRTDDALLVRVHNPTPEPTTVVVDGHSGWLVDLRGRPLEPFEGRFELGPWRIANAVVTAP